MATPGKNSTAACLWLLMLTLDADGRRRDVEFSEIEKCLADLTPTLSDDPGRQPEALMASLNLYYDEIKEHDSDHVLGVVLQQIDDPALRQEVFVMLVRVAISDKQLHRDENTLLRQIGEAWGLQFDS
ncbi:MAG: TerB family tellurite resistance protein [Alphaproteobacteria bacterium]